MTQFCKHGLPLGMCRLGEKDCKQSTWQGLTDDEIVKELERTDEYMGKSFFAGVRWAEQALKEKNT